MGAILPFSGFSFFFLAFLFVIFLHILKHSPVSKFISYRNVLFMATILYFYYCFPSDSSKALLAFILYTYSVYWIFVKNDYYETLFPVIVIALPMILYKLDVEPMYKMIGISYVTFRSVQAIIDSKNQGTMSFVEFSTFLFLPTTLLAGPIDTSYRFKQDLDNGYANLTLSNIIKGWDILALGILFKFVIADMVNKFWLSDSDASSTNALDMINSAYAYTAYLYFDFAGYSAMAVGLSIMVGIFTPPNFKKPYLAVNPQDFWRRFHITLGSWLTNYFFKPFYKYLHRFEILKKRRLLTQNIAIISTFVFMGFWNGITWYYIFSGFLFGVYSAIHNIYVYNVRKNKRDFFLFFPKALSLGMKRLLMVNSAVLALYFFSGRVPL